MFFSMIIRSLLSLVLCLGLLVGLTSNPALAVTYLGNSLLGQLPSST